MSDDTPTPEHRQALAEIGQKLVDLISDEINERGLGDLQVVLDTLVSVAAYYLAGIGEEAVRGAVLQQFCEDLRKGVDMQIEAGAGASVDVLDATKPN